MLDRRNHCLCPPFFQSLLIPFALLHLLIIAIARLDEHGLLIVPVPLADLSVSFSPYPMPLDS